ncbi:hypothetical protein AWZ03_003752 [Drosophila navojoa]|uniref:Uncharacterized protein n=1 Tax=Drosophila navojoa TaxID=7232 RepID=A0A484BM59_DRONA|nr:hypothetical protein AWZ03_003752 [Drosophila navojoa]
MRKANQKRVATTTLTATPTPTPTPTLPAPPQPHPMQTGPKNRWRNVKFQEPSSIGKQIRVNEPKAAAVKATATATATTVEQLAAGICARTCQANLAKTLTVLSVVCVLSALSV